MEVYIQPLKSIQFKMGLAHTLNAKLATSKAFLPIWECVGTGEYFEGTTSPVILMSIAQKPPMKTGRDKRKVQFFSNLLLQKGDPPSDSMEAPTKNPLEDELELPMSGDLVSNFMSVLKKPTWSSNGYEF